MLQLEFEIVLVKQIFSNFEFSNYDESLTETSLIKNFIFIFEYTVHWIFATNIADFFFNMCDERKLSVLQ